MGLLKSIKNALLGASYEDLPIIERVEAYGSIDMNVLDVLEADKIWIPSNLAGSRLIKDMFVMNVISKEIGSHNSYIAKKPNKTGWDGDHFGDFWRFWKYDLKYSASFVGELHWFETVRTAKWNYNFVSFSPRKGSDGDIIRRGRVVKGASTLLYEIHSLYPRQRNWWQYSHGDTRFICKKGQSTAINGNIADLEDPGFQYL